MKPQKNKNREVILADMHDDGVHFNRALLSKQKKMRQAKKSKRSNKNKTK